MLDKKSLMFFEEISPPLQQETEDATQMASNKQWLCVEDYKN